MAISPNTDFTSGQILTAAQQNQFPRGIMQRVASTSSTTGTVTEAVTLTLPAFTAVANRYYRITYFEPYMETLAASVEINAQIRMTNLAGAVIARAVTFVTTINGEAFIRAEFVGTLSAGSTVVVATLRTVGGSTNVYGATDYNRLLWVEDIGPA
jgi:hypothetical protein